MKIPFAEVKDSKEFMTDVQLRLIRQIHQGNSQYISASNYQVFAHGTSWTFQRQEQDGYSEQTGQMQPFSQQVAFGIDRLLANDVTVLPEFVLEFAHQASSQLLARMIREMNASAEQTGNVIHVTSESSMADAFLELISRGVWSIDASGNAIPPSIILAPEDQARLTKEVAERGEPFRQQVEQIKRQKEASARQVEEERIKKYGSDA